MSRKLCGCPLRTREETVSFSAKFGKFDFHSHVLNYDFDVVNTLSRETRNEAVIQKHARSPVLLDIVSLMERLSQIWYAVKVDGFQPEKN